MYLRPQRHANHAISGVRYSVDTSNTRNLALLGRRCGNPDTAPPAVFFSPPPAALIFRRLHLFLSSSSLLPLPHPHPLFFLLSSFCQKTVVFCFQFFLCQLFSVSSTLVLFVSPYFFLESLSEWFNRMSSPLLQLPMLFSD